MRDVQKFRQRSRDVPTGVMGTENVRKTKSRSERHP